MNDNTTIFRAVKNNQIHLSIILIDGFSLLSLSAFIEPLQIANDMLKQEIYSWVLLSKNGVQATSSSGLTLHVDKGIDDITTPHNIILCGDSGDPKMANHTKNIIGNITDSNVDMALNDIKARFGHDMSMLVKEQFLLKSHEKDNNYHNNNIEDLPLSTPIHHPKLIQAIHEMENNTETILSRNEIARRVGLSQRQLERLFQRYLNTSPARYYLKLRLNRARNLLIKTPMAITEIAFACGFISPSHFSKCYRDLFDISPKKERTEKNTGKNTLKTNIPSDNMQKKYNKTNVNHAKKEMELS